MLFVGSLLTAQNIPLTESAKVSMITVAPGTNLVDSFGHSAIRIRDDSLAIDIAYNFGTYDFNAPNFYGNFARGKLLYILGRNYFSDFLNYYSGQNRTVKEQVLDLTLAERQAFLDYLQHNAKPENRGYLYDFFYDNCATKLRDVTQDILGEKVEFDYSFADTKGYTLRGLIHKYSYTQPWGTFGIDLALGSVIDRKAKSEEYIFLPDYIFETFQSAKKSNENGAMPLTKQVNILFQASPQESNKGITPLIVLGILALLILGITIGDFKRNKRSRWLDVFLFFTTGVIGVCMLLLWFATDHTATARNYNVLWAFAPNVIVAFFLLKRSLKPWIKTYLQILLLLLLLTVLFWIFRIQQFNIAVAAILIMLGIRYLYLLQKLKVPDQTT